MKKGIWCAALAVLYVVFILMLFDISWKAAGLGWLASVMLAGTMLIMVIEADE